MIPMQELVERVLAASTADGCIVVGSEHTETNLRWAANSLTTNGQMRVAVGHGHLDPRRSGRDKRRRGHPLGDHPRTRWSIWSARANRPAREPAPADDAAPLVEPL